MSFLAPTVRSASHSFNPSRTISTLASSSRLIRPTRSSASLLRPSSSQPPLKASEATAPINPKPTPSSDLPSPPRQQELPRIKDQGKMENGSFIGVFNWQAALIFVGTGIGIYYYFEKEKEKAEEYKRKEKARQQKTGRPLIGGPFELVDADGKTFTEKDLLGKWSLMYFGFSNCPDICPEELDKMSDVVDMIDKQYGEIARPVFVSCDPARDDIPQVKKYISEFHPRTVGLTGEYEAIKKMCKVFRVYFSTPPGALATDDYLVDHSIYFYLMDPDGAFVEAFGKEVPAHDVYTKFQEFHTDYQEDADIAKRLLQEEIVREGKKA